MSTFHLPVRIGIFLTVLFCLGARKEKAQAQLVSPVTKPDVFMGIIGNANIL